MSTPSPQPASIESWEQKEAQIRQERADQFTKLSPEEQANVLAEEKVKFQETQAKLKEDLGYGDFDPKEHQAKLKSDRQKEAAAKQAEVNQMEENLRRPKEEAGPKESKEQKPEIDLAKFLSLFTAATENIKQKKPFEFESAALDDFARPVKQKAYMKELFDHSQKAVLREEQIRERLEKGQAAPEQISLTLEVDMGEDKNNHLGLTNLQLRLSLAALTDGHLTEKLARFTNLVLYAAVMHNRQKVAGVRQQRTGTQYENEADKTKEIKKETEKFAITQMGESGGLQNASRVFELGETGSVVFAVNNGAVWGTFESHGAPVNPKQLQESIDKTGKEQ